MRLNQEKYITMKNNENYCTEKIYQEFKSNNGRMEKRAKKREKIRKIKIKRKTDKI